MSITFSELRDQSEELIRARANALTAKLERDDAKLRLDEVELEIRYDGALSGKISGKNAETRAAEEANLQRTNPQWQQAVDAFRQKEEAVRRAVEQVEVETLRLKTLGMGWNAQIAEQVGGTSKLLSEVNLASAGVS